MTKDEALRMALEALETSTDWDVSATGRQLKSMQAITALRTALAQTQEPVAWEQFHEHMAGPFYKAPPQPEQEPLAWISTGPARMIHWTSDKPAYGDDWVPLYTTPPQRKPQYDKTKMNCFVQDLYDKKIQEGKHGQYEAMFHVVHRAIEAAHGIKGKYL